MIKTKEEKIVGSPFVFPFSDLKFPLYLNNYKEIMMYQNRKGRKNKDSKYQRNKKKSLTNI